VSVAEVLFGAAYVDTHAVLLGNINSNSPLTFDARMLGSLRAYAAHNQGTIIVPAVLAGAMGPVTAAGCMSELLAETLAGMGLSMSSGAVQLFRFLLCGRAPGGIHDQPGGRCRHCKSSAH
jgi:trimethylamine:corrinoid methyltransferase-like protein